MTRIRSPFCWSLFAVTFALLSPCWAESELLDVELARDIENRAPVHPYSPAIFCEKDKNRDSPLPIVKTDSDRQVVFWNRVTSTTPEVFHHTWHKKTKDGWESVADVRLPVQESSSYRIWSTKEIHPTLHVGEWMIVVSLEHDPQTVLCIARFLVE